MERALQDVLYKPAKKIFKESFERITVSEMTDKAFKTTDKDWYMFGI
jgi:hypothetical protein